MKKQFFAIAFASLLTGTAVAASTGYTGPNAGNITTVAGALQASDDAPVVLIGNLVQKVKGDTYEFRDATGSIHAEIEHDQWPAGAAVSETTRVRLHGEVDKDLTSREIDVERVELVN
ncbi:YgiW/YdeI family stress tolerance OB fold protein [Pseudomonas typographi]|uniref:NirD/YgiW/YdeI family stress tolerance protein n=1 Tax=Pseudomonas typographi TaxID=2715964 RepID=A0ABR7Z5X7_9PSED|nr:NirD/YgiW/YdeI family stress tolerance protein [Pseudomonas typographi]MBD1600812.1 NirD/YgiW/YdeI family stress tolerance protein [Pseudomonas typographi]